MATAPTTMPMDMNMHMSMGTTMATMMGNDTMTMQMSFFFGNFKLLFDTWNVNDGGALFGAMVAIFFLTMALEALKAFREWLHGWTLEKYVKVKGCGGVKQSELKDNSTNILVVVKNRDLAMPVLLHVIQSILFTIQVGVTYLLMLAVMSYNGAIFITVCIGAGFGYLSFGWVSLYIGEKSKREQAGYCH
ncbi:hypothetical protein EMCRGX_G012029 [Ephydatia muelleri]